jgi:hypothetical protein
MAAIRAFFHRTLSMALLLACMASICGCNAILVNDKAVSARNNLDVFDKAWVLFRDKYPFFIQKNVNWDSVRLVYRPQMEQAQGDESFVVMANMLNTLHDGHVSLQMATGVAFRVVPPRELRDKGAYNPEVVRSYFQQPLQRGSKGTIEYGVLPQNIGYIYVSTFGGDGDRTGRFASSWTNDFHSALESLRATKGLILDVRENPGGYGGNMYALISRFTARQLPALVKYVRVLPDTYQTIPASSPIGVLYPDSTRFRYAQPVVVLINGTCFSATELFTEMIKQVPTVTVLGDTTGGGGGNTNTYLLPNGISIAIPDGDWRKYDNQPIEWNGVAPHIRVPQTKGDAQRGKDFQMERAILQVLR